MVTLKDVALKAGVNPSTVSRALNHRSGVSDELIRKIELVADELGYLPNYSARIMAGKRSNIIGFIGPEIESNYFSRIVCEVERILKMEGYSMMYANTHFERQNEITALTNFINYNVDGIFLSCTINQDILDQFSPILNEKNIPLILLEARMHSKDYNYILVDDEAGMLNAIRYLLSKGHKRIGFLSDHILVTFRNNLFRSAVKKAGLDPDDNPIYIHKTKRFEAAGYEIMSEVLADPNRPTAFLAGYDDIAIGAMRAAKEAGLKIPDDFAVIGNDNIRESSYLYNSLTTLSPPLEKMAKLGVDLMMNSIMQNDINTIHHIDLKPELIIREST